MSLKHEQPLEGVLFEVPLTGRTVDGLVVRHRPRENLAVCYFYPVGSSRPPTPVSEPLWVKRCSDLALVGGIWPLRNRLVPWSRQDWPMPRFKGLEGGRPIVVTYDDDTLSQVDWRFAMDSDELDALPDDGDAQVGFVEKRLSRLIGSAPSAGN